MRYVLATALLLILGGWWVSAHGQINNPTGGGGITLTTAGTSGAATLTGGVLNIPIYSGGGSSYTFSLPLVNTAGTVSINNATGSAVGVMKPDGTSCTVSAGVLSCTGTSGLTTGPSGALSIISGVIDGVNSVIAYLGNANPWTGKNTFQQGVFTYGAPSISSGFGSSPSIAAASGPGGGRITVGSGGSATTGVIAWAIQPAVAPACTGNDETSSILTRVAATTTGLTFTGSSAWSAADTLTYTCTGLSTTLP